MGSIKTANILLIIILILVGACAFHAMTAPKQFEAGVADDGTAIWKKSTRKASKK